ncbi:MAG TPA: hypothetical protein VFO48_06270 [Vicinamibacterales bacterium]|nr:hypothetical protein [Vicinamibacterales bacterium]
MSLEQELRRALRRKDPPSGFDDRVLSRIAAGETVRLSQPRTRWARVSLPIAASVMLAFGAAMYMQHQQQQRREEEQRTRVEQSAREVVLALQIASDTISAAQAKVEEITRYEPTNSY